MESEVSTNGYEVPHLYLVHCTNGYNENGRTSEAATRVTY